MNYALPASIKSRSHLIPIVMGIGVLLIIGGILFAVIQDRILRSEQVQNTEVKQARSPLDSVNFAALATSTAVESREQKNVKNSESTKPGPAGYNTTHGGVQNDSYNVFVAPDSYYKIPGSMVIFTGSHFAPHETVTACSGGSIITSITADASGRFMTPPIAVPYSVDKPVYVFTGSRSNIPFPVMITIGPVKPWITLSTYYAGQGGSLIIQGHTFGSFELVTINYDGITIGTVQADGVGNFRFRTAVPQGGIGQKIVEALGMATAVSDTEVFSQAY